LSHPLIAASELESLEDTVTVALKRHDTSGLNIVGFGELSVALGWPNSAPEWVCKRTPPFTPSQFAHYKQLVGTYVDQVRASGMQVVDTTVVGLQRGDRTVAYVVQPMLAAASLGHNVLAACEPDPDHRFLTALADAIGIVSTTLSIDAQVTNFSWDGSVLTLIDVGTPMMWDDNGKFLFEMDPFLRMIPAPTRRLVKWDMTKVVERWSDKRQVAIDIVANLYREGLTDWVDPTITALNRGLQPIKPITASEALRFYEQDAKTWPRLKKLQAAQRWWQTMVRRRPYDFFIHSTFNA